MNTFTTARVLPLERGSVDLESREIRGPCPGRLSPTEARLLAYLAARAERVVDRAELLEQVWGYRPGTESRTVFATVERLRKKIEADPAAPRHVVTVGRSGYQFRPAGGPVAPVGPATAPAGPPPTEAPNNLPASADRFVGRDAELGALLAALGDDLLVTLRGPGGSGKTRLATELGRRALGRFPGGVWFVELLGCEQRHDLVQALGRAIALPLGGADAERHLLRIQRVLRGRGPTLLVLDNAEQAVPALTAMVESWPAPRPSMLVTSRVALRANGERVVPVDPLPIGGDAETLFLDRCAARRPDFAATAADREATREIVSLLDGLPLAIELAARWSSVLDPPALLARLRGSGLPMLRAAPGDPRPERHRTLDATLRWSWETLSDDERRAFAACAVFRGGFSADAAEAVFAGRDLEALEWLERLVDVSLVREVRRDGVARFELLEPVREFAAERLAESGRAPEVERRHASFYARFGSEDRLRELARGADGAAWSRFAGEIGNLERAIGWGDAEPAALAACAAAAVYRMVGPSARATAPLETALQRPGLPADLKVRMLHDLGLGYRIVGDGERALETLRRAARDAASDAPSRAAWIEDTLGTTETYYGSQQRARAHLERARELHAAQGDDYGRAQAELELAGMALREGRTAAATRQYQEVLRVLRRVGARHAEAVCLGNLGVAQLKLARFDEARRSLDESLAVHHALGSHQYDGQVLCNLGLLYELWRRPDEAAAAYQASLRAALESGQRRDEGIVRANLASLHLAHGDTQSARRHLDAADDVFDELGLPLQQADARLTRAWLCRSTSDPSAAEAPLDDALRLIDLHGFEELRPRERSQRGLLALALGDRPTASARLEEARRLAGALGLGPDTEAGREIASLQAALG